MGTDTAPADHADGEHGSRWPLVTAVGAAALYAGAGLAFVGIDLAGTVVPALLVGAGLLGLVAGLAGWTREAFVVGRPPAGRDRVYTGGMVLFLVSDVATFLAGFVYYGFIRAGAWPPAELPPLLSSLVLANTLVLLASSLTLHRSHGALEAGDQRTFRRWLGLTVLLGAVFLAGQALEYYEFAVVEGFGFEGAFGSAFFGLTGLHGLHVALGVVLLAITLGRARRGGFAPDRDTGVRTASLYWHFVDAVWVVLVATLYVGAALG
jgi:cytochrome c oxidase subunit 3